MRLVSRQNRPTSWTFLPVLRLQWLSMANGEPGWVVGNAVVTGQSPHIQRAASGRGGASELAGMGDLLVPLPAARLPSEWEQGGSWWGRGGPITGSPGRWP